MKGTSNLECANALVILALKEEFDFWFRWFLSLEWSANKGFYCLRSGCEVGEGG